ncbi:DUF262 domain-containing protein [Agrococcus jejuensis]|uniref:DUF262 domain-containing protein n=1 Tax=Agrococcus jejuensis TaxID=399736 RepID=UPI0011A6856A|nr:DUF262 domain-containing protein [Agrococcus jejuensis]
MAFDLAYVDGRATGARPYAAARSKAVATARMYYLGNRVAEPLGPGSKEKKSSLVALGSFAELDLSDVAGKVECGRRIAEFAGVLWDSDCYSAGDTITLIGMNRLLDGVLHWHIRSGRQPVRSLIRDLISVNPAPKWDDDLEDEVPTDIGELENNIAELLADLSGDGPVPEGVAPVAVGIERDDVRVHDGSWRTALARVEGWLHLTAEIDTRDDDAFDESLAALLLLDDGWTNEDLFERLQYRLERATDLRSRFMDELEGESEGEATAATATANWVSSWEESDDANEGEDSGPIRALANVWPILEFQSKALQGELELSPSYQRADVWPTRDAQQLIESILRGIPLPSVIILERNTEDGGQYEIVDGKQRLTSILRFIGLHPRALEVVRQKAHEWGVADLEATFRSNYPEFKKLWKLNERESLSQGIEREHFFPFVLRSTGQPMPLNGELEQLRGKYYSQIKDIAIDVVNAKRKISTIFEQMSEYRIPVIIYQQASTKQVHEVFALYNRQGKHLNAEEIRNATFHELDLMRALLVTAGDSKNVARVAPFLEADWADLESTGEQLAGYGFPDAGYKRTKVLSWVASSLLFEPEGGTKISAMATSKHINLFLGAVEAARPGAIYYPLRDRRKVTDLMLLLDHAVDAHAALGDEPWAEQFHRENSKWQELQLVAALIAFAVAAHVYMDDVNDVVEDALDEITTRSADWVRPPKTQSREQWKFISRVVAELLEILGVEIDVADQALRKSFGSSGLRLLIDLTERADDD